jgi:hypothetical protein
MRAFCCHHVSCGVPVPVVRQLLCPALALLLPVLTELVVELLMTVTPQVLGGSVLRISSRWLRQVYRLMCCRNAAQYIMCVHVVRHCVRPRTLRRHVERLHKLLVLLHALVS